MEKLNKLLELWDLTVDKDVNMIHLAHSTKDLDNGAEIGFQASYSLDSECLVFEYAGNTMVVTTHEKWCLTDFVEYFKDNDDYDWNDIFDDMYSWRSISDMDELFSDPQGYCDEYFKNNKSFVKVDVEN